jgi:hypothetical protein
VLQGQFTRPKARDPHQKDRDRSRALRAEFALNALCIWREHVGQLALRAFQLFFSSSSSFFFFRDYETMDHLQGLLQKSVMDRMVQPKITAFFAAK